MSKEWADKQSEKGIMYFTSIAQGVYEFEPTTDTYDVADIMATGITNQREYAIELKVREVPSEKYDTILLENYKLKNLTTHYQDRICKYVCFYTDGVFFCYNLSAIDFSKLKYEYRYCPASTAERQDGIENNRKKKVWLLPKELARTGHYDPQRYCGPTGQGKSD